MELSATIDNGRACIRVRDSSVGIASEDLPFIFDRFYQADKSRAGAGKMGLGLAISKELMDAMGGDISAESVPNHGTTITLSLAIAS